MKILIKDSKIVAETQIFQSDILIEDGLIKALASGITSKADRVIDASGRYIFPGGIDPHVHMHLPTAAGYSADDFYTGSKAALFGGTTTIIDFVTPRKGQSLVDALEERIKEAENSLVDFTFHISPIEWRETTEAEINECVRRGFPSFKVYMAYKSSIGLSDDALQKVMAAVAKAGGMVTVHAELGDEIELLRNKFYSEGKTEPLYHPLSRPSYTESEAVKRVIEMAYEAQCTLYIVHVSSKDSLYHIKKAQQQGQKVFAETCPHYLLLNDSVYDGCFLKTAPFVLSPPLRKADDSLALWAAMFSGAVQTIGTDHCPFSMKQKEEGISDFRKIPNGAGGVEHRLALLYNYGVLENRITLQQFVGLASTQPAKIFGLYPRKGEVALGSDADLVIWNPNISRKISALNHHQAADINIYEGLEVRGYAEVVIVNGMVAIDQGSLVNENQLKGKLLQRIADLPQ
jgi:dihydropyrimidinase